SGGERLADWVGVGVVGGAGVGAQVPAAGPVGARRGESAMSQDIGGAAGARRWRAGGGRLSREAQGGIAAVLLLLIAIIFPLVITDQVATQIGVDTMLFVAATVAWDPFSGFTRYISLRAPAFFRPRPFPVGVP